MPGISYDFWNIGGFTWKEQQLSNSRKNTQDTAIRSTLLGEVKNKRDFDTVSSFL